MDVTRAVGFGRLHNQWLPDVVSVDTWGLEPQTQRQLEALDHVFTTLPGWGDAQAVRVDPLTGLRAPARIRATKERGPAPTEGEARVAVPGGAQGRQATG